MAANASTLADGDGEFSDWIEFYNPTAQTINLAGWHLTDDIENLEKWTFPALSQSILDPGEFLIVFASPTTIENYVDPAGYLHADFALSADGEDLALTDPQSNIVHQYESPFPRQVSDVSYGLQENASSVTLIGPSQAAKALVPTGGLLDAPAVGVAPAWTLPAFDDSAWAMSDGGPGVGFDFSDDTVPNVPNGTLLPGGPIGGDLTDADENGTPDGIFVAGGFPGSPAGEEPNRALDDTAATKWLAFEPTGTFYEFRFSDGQQHAVNEYTITSANDAPSRDPYAWTLSGSHDGVSYTVVDGRSAQSFANRFETRHYQFNNNTSYEYYRFDFQTHFGVTGLESDRPNANAIQMAEIELFSRGPVNFGPLIDVNVEAPWLAAQTSVYERIEFDVADPSTFVSLMLEMQYNDGFVAYLNGTQVAAVGAPTLPNYQSHATGERDDAESLVPQSINLTPNLGELLTGTNVLAIHALNASDSNPDLLARPQLVARELIDDTVLHVYMPEPTPGAVNTNGFVDIVDTPEFSVERGFYDAPFQLAITSGTPGAEIYYTTDGLPPTPADGLVYTGPITVSSTGTLRAQAFLDGFLQSSPVTHTYLFINDIVRQDYQATLSAGFPTSWGGISPDYGMDSDVIGDFDVEGNLLGGDLFAGTYAATIKDDLQAIPSLSIVMDLDQLFGPSGIYTNSTAGGVAWERPTSVELIYPDGTQGFQIDAGIRTHGGAFRRHDLSRKHSFRLVFKGIYEGNTKLEFPWFGDDAASSFDTIVLRMDSNDGYAWDAAGTRPQYARDEWGRRTQLALGQPASHGTRVHLYINGIYWGIYNPVERPDASFSASYYGGQKEEWDAINTGDPLDGTLDAWNTLNALSQAVSQANSEMARTAAYMRVLGLNSDGTDNPNYETYLDAVNYIDYLIVNFYGANSDWPHRNWFASRRRGPESQGFVFHSWDFEWTLGLQSSVSTNRLNVSDGAAGPYSRLTASEEFRVLFGDRVHRALFNNGALTADNSVARYEEIIQELPEAIVGETARWGDMHRSFPYTQADWEGETPNVVNFLTNRGDILLQQLKNAGLYPTIDAPSLNQFGGQVTPGFELTMSSPASTIWYTLDGSDPRMMSGAISPSAIQYTSPVTLSTGTQLKARASTRNGWSALVDANFTVPSGVLITELHYNPADFPGVADRQDLEFIELLNAGSVTMSLAGVQIAGFAQEPYVFASGVDLAAGQRIIVARNPAVFQSVYGTDIYVAPGGYSTSNLSNGGEQVLLLGPLGETLQDFIYSDTNPWPTAPDGDGPSLEIIDPMGNPNDPANWRASNEVGGSPGTDGSLPESLPGDYDGNQLVDADDYAVWKATFATIVAPGTGADGNSDGVVNSADYTIWRNNMETPAAASGSEALLGTAAKSATSANFEAASAATSVANLGATQESIVAAPLWEVQKSVDRGVWRAPLPDLLDPLLNQAAETLRIGKVPSAFPFHWLAPDRIGTTVDVAVGEGVDWRVPKQANRMDEESKRHNLSPDVSDQWATDIWEDVAWLDQCTGRLG